MRKLFSFVAVAALAVGGLSASAAPANASDVGTPGVTGRGSATMVAPINPDQRLVVFWCAAAATEVAASTSVDSCRLYADGEYVTSAESISLSGQAAATAGVATVDSWTSTLKACWDVSTDPILGAPKTDSACTTVNTLALAA